jgi:hypothetical protein
VPNGSLYAAGAGVSVANFVISAVNGGITIDAANLSTGTIPDIRIANASTWNAKSATGQSAACTYGVANLSLSSSGSPAVTCAGQQGTVTSVGTGTYLQGGPVTTSGTLDLNTTVLNASYDARYYSTSNPNNYTSGTAFALYNYTTADITSLNTSIYNSTIFNRLYLLPSSTYLIDCRLMTDAASVNTGTQLRINTTNSPTTVDIVYTSMTSATTMETLNGSNTASNTFADLGNGGNNLRSIAWVQGYIVTAGSVSNWTMEMKTETTGSEARIRRGSYCRGTKVA